MKVLLISNMYPDKDHPSYGIFVKRFVDELNEIGVECQKSVMYQHDGKISKIWGYLFFYISTYFKVLFGKYDCVYVHQAAHSSPPVIAASKLRNIRIYTNVHGCDVAPENTRQERMQKYAKNILKCSDRVIVPSEYYKEYIVRKFGVANEKIYVYPSAGINKDIFYEKSNEQKLALKDSFKFEKDTLVFGMAGRISEGKGWDTFVEAVAALKKDNVKATFVIVGTGREDNKLENLIRDLHLEDDIIRIGLLPQAKLCDFYNAIDYFVFPTRRESESLGLVAIEAMACGTPVIASDFAAPKYYIKDGVNGFKFKVNDSKEMVVIMKKCCTSIDKQNYQILHDGAVETAKMYFSGRIRRELESVMNCTTKTGGGV